MKKFILGFALVLTTIAATAQDTLTYTSALKVQFGGAYPTGDFKSADFEKEYPPFATSGTMLQVNYLRSIHPNFSAGATLALRHNPVNIDEFADPSDELVLSRETKPWQSVFTLADLQYQIGSNYNMFYLRGSLGTAFNRKSSIKVNTPFGMIDQPAANNIALAYGLHTGIAQYFNRWGLGIETGVLSTRPTFNVTNQQGRNITFSQTMTTINLSLFGSYSF